jgi:Cu/Ag efflux pump CusA
MQRVMMQANGELQRIPGIRRVATHLGRAVTGDQVVGIESAQTWVSLELVADYDSTLGAVREVVEGYPGLNAKIETYLESRLKETLLEPDSGIVVRVEGPVNDLLQREAERVRQALTGIAGLANLRLATRREVPHVEIEVDLVAAGRVGLKPGNVRRAVATVFAGLDVGLLFEQQKVFDVVVWGEPGARQSLSDVRHLLISDDQYVRLSDIAQVRVVPTAQMIEREGVSRGIKILADIDGRDANAVAADVRARLQSIEFPLEYHAVLMPDYAKRREDHKHAVIAALAAAAGIFLLLQACFRSWRFPALFGLSLMAAPLGGVLAILAAGGNTALGALAGLLAILGLAARYGIGLVSRFQELERQAGRVIGPGLVLRAVRDRAPFILTSAAAIGAALVPVVAFGHAAGLEDIHPMAVAMLGGLVTTVIVTLVVVPTLYLFVASPLSDNEESARFEHAA